MNAAERVMVSDGFSALTIDALVREVGTTRPAFYRRYDGIPYLVFDVLRRKFNSQSFESSGALAADFLKLQRDEITMFSGALLRNNLPGLLELARTKPDLVELYSQQFVQPRRAWVQLAIDAAVERGEISQPTVDTGFICDLLLGPLMARALLPNIGELDDELAQATAAVALSQLTR
ncbi:MAG: TetR-like C-terminal domain-containing protein [Microbacteriaceae bacterium]